MEEFEEYKPCERKPNSFKLYFALLAMGVSMGFWGGVYVGKKEAEKKIAQVLPFVEQESAYTDIESVQFSRPAHSTFENGWNEICAVRGLYDSRLRKGLVDVMADGKELVTSKKAQQGIDAMLSRDTLVGKLLRPYKGSAIAPIPTVQEEARFEQLLNDYKKWRPVITPLIDTDGDDKYSDEELHRAVYKALH
jgi:hypothetical protein